MKLPLSGKCLCNTVHFSVVQEPLTLYACHCTDCQTVSGASFTLILRVGAKAIRVDSNEEPRHYERARSDGRTKTIMRCPNCLTALWGKHDDPAKAVSVYAGTLDCSSDLVPIGHIWLSSAQPWIQVAPSALKHSKQPENMDEFYDAWVDNSPAVGNDPHIG